MIQASAWKLCVFVCFPVQGEGINEGHRGHAYAVNEGPKVRSRSRARGGGSLFTISGV